MKILNWFIKSSVDPAKLSLTIKSLAVFAVLFGLDKSLVEEGSDIVVNAIVILGQVVAIGMTAFAFARKVYRTNNLK